MKKTTRFLFNLKWAWKYEQNQFRNLFVEFLSGLLFLASGLIVTVWALLQFAIEPIMIFLRPLYFSTFRTAKLEKAIKFFEPK